jgi:hypothetical protein
MQIVCYCGNIVVHFCQEAFYFVGSEKLNFLNLMLANDYLRVSDEVVLLLIFITSYAQRLFFIPVITQSTCPLPLNLIDHCLALPS